MRIPISDDIKGFVETTKCLKHSKHQCFYFSKNVNGDWTFGEFKKQFERKMYYWSLFYRK